MYKNLPAVGNHGVPLGSHPPRLKSPVSIERHLPPHLSPHKEQEYTKLNGHIVIVDNYYGVGKVNHPGPDDFLEVHF
jgi:hypothetical protein